MTLYYRAPEVILNNLNYTNEIDLWSAGVIIYEMLTGDYLFKANSEIEMLFKIFHLKGTPVSKPINNGQPQISRYDHYPILKDYGLKFPQLKKRSLLEHKPALKVLGPNTQKWIELIDGLTQIDPYERITIERSLSILKKIGDF